MSNAQHQNCYEMVLRATIEYITEMILDLLFIKNLSGNVEHVCISDL